VATLCATLCEVNELAYGAATATGATAAAGTSPAGLAEAVIMADANTATAANVIFMMAFIFGIWLV